MMSLGEQRGSGGARKKAILITNWMYSCVNLAQKREDVLCGTNGSAEEKKNLLLALLETLKDRHSK